MKRTEGILYSDNSKVSIEIENGFKLSSNKDPIHRKGYRNKKDCYCTL